MITNESCGYGDHDVQCVQCGEVLVHHSKVEVFERTEDAERGLYVAVEEGGLTVDSNSLLEGNPSKRRQGLKIHFWCEVCRCTFSMNISQHKGNTYIEFVKTGELAE